MIDTGDSITDNIVSFIMTAKRDFNYFDYTPNNRLRISMPEYIEKLFFDKTPTGKKAGELMVLCGIRVQYSHENVITVFCIDAPVNPHRNYPIYKLQLMSTKIEPRMSFKVTIK